MSQAASATTVAPRQRSAHARAVSSDQNDALRALVAALGKHAVAAIFDKDARTIERWLKPGVQLKMEDERRLRDAFHVFSLIEQADDVNLARAWFIGMNPQLDDDSPIEHLAAGNARAVLAAARAYVNAG
jgi:hypothetical protein